VLPETPMKNFDGTKLTFNKFLPCFLDRCLWSKSHSFPGRNGTGLYFCYLKMSKMIQIHV